MVAVYRAPSCPFELNEQLLNVIKSVNSVNEKYEMFLCILHHAIELFVPVKRVCAHRAYLPAYLQRMHRRYSLFFVARGSQSESDWEKFHDYSCKFDRALRKYNMHVEKKIINRFFKLLNKKLLTFRKVSCIVKDDCIAVLDEDKANLLADRFCEVFSEDDNLLPSFTANIECSMLDFPWFDGSSGYSLLKELPSSSSLTPDCIPATFVKKIAHIVAD
ncbi:hypothetical protein OSTOST_25302, partial [Ostertagia ostertagi]